MGHDLDRAMQVAERLASGTIRANQHMAMHPSVPVRGAEQSGLGDFGQEGLWDYIWPSPSMRCRRIHEVS